MAVNARLVMERLIYCEEQRKRKEEGRPVLSKVAVVVAAANGSRDSALYWYNG
jgi:tellurite resistance protein